MVYVIDLAGVAVFAVSGALAAGRKGLDVFGVVVIATVTAIGGGTTRDLLLDRHPVLWVDDPTYVGVSAGAALLTMLLVRRRGPHERALAVADALGLGFFVVSGAGIAMRMGLHPSTVIIMGVMTGVAGGVVRDVLTAEIPFILRQGELYATAAIAGAATYLLLGATALPEPVTAAAGVFVTVAIRLAAIAWNIRLPSFRLEGD